jgi:hypothetical protein
LSRKYRAGLGNADLPGDSDIFRSIFLRLHGRRTSVPLSSDFSRLAEVGDSLRAATERAKGFLLITAGLSYPGQGKLPRRREFFRRGYS